MKRKYLKDKLMMIVAELDDLSREVYMLAREIPDEDPMFSDAQLQGAMSPKELPPEDR